MTDLVPRLEADTPIAEPDIGSAAAKLAQRLCHDFMSPASGVVSGLDLLDDPSAAALHDEARALVASSARKLVESLVFTRAAFGSGPEAFDTDTLEAMARGHFAHLRPELDWAVDTPSVSAAVGRALLHLVQLAAAALAAGGRARVMVKLEGSWSAVIVEAAGERARLHPEVAAGLRGEAFDEGPGGRWVQAFLLHELVRGAGGVVAAEVREGEVVFRAAMPS